MGDDPQDRSQQVARPWEDDDLPVPPEGESPADADGGDDSFHGLDAGPSALDDFTDDDYLSATTREYQGLAESVAEADTQQYERQAVAASLPGVGSGLIGFEDVTGERGVTEEDIEAVEQQRASDLTLRVVSAIALAGVFIGSLVLGGAWFSTFVTLAMVLSVGEFYAALRTVGYNPLALFGLVGVVGAAVGAHFGGSTGIYGWVIATIAAIALFYGVATRRNALENAGVTILGTAWVSMLAFAIVIGRSDAAVPLILLVVLGTATFDIGAYFVGKTFGRRQLAPSVSPNKTVEGLVGGIAATVALLTVLSTFPVFDPLTVIHAALLAGGICVLAPVGDAAESVIKRAIGVKDMGSVLPGHGGVLDRIDALLFVAPFAYYLFSLLDYL